MIMNRKQIKSMLGVFPQHVLERLKEEYLVDIEDSKIKMENDLKDIPFYNRPIVLPPEPGLISEKKSHSKPVEQITKEVLKRRKKNKNKKTHRRK